MSDWLRGPVINWCFDCKITGKVPTLLRGGERRRTALALALAHADLASSRGGVTCDLLVLDEVLQHLARGEWGAGVSNKGTRQTRVC